MSKRKSTTVRRKAQPKHLNRLLELAERRGYSSRALTALALSVIVAHASRKAVRRG